MHCKQNLTSQVNPKTWTKQFHFTETHCPLDPLINPFSTTSPLHCAHDSTSQVDAKTWMRQFYCTVMQLSCTPRPIMTRPSATLRCVTDTIWPDTSTWGPGWSNFTAPKGPRAATHTPSWSICLPQSPCWCAWNKIQPVRSTWGPPVKAISLHRDALEQRPPPHPDRSDSLNNLAALLRTRFEQSGQSKDLDEAISLHRDAITLRLAHSERPMSLNNLANALNARFIQSGQPGDLDEAILLHREALGLRPVPHPDRSLFLNNFANVLSTRFDQSGQCKDLDEAISSCRGALELQAASHVRRSGFLNNLASFLNTRFSQSGRREDLDEAITVIYKSLDARVSIHDPQTCFTSINLGKTFMNMYSHTRQSEDLDKAMEAFRVAVNCETAPAFLRFRSAKLWASHADASGHQSALEAYQAAIELLPRLAMLGLDVLSRQQALASGSDGLARDAAACAIRSYQYGKAVELLEAGRAVFWSQALRLRTSVSDLHDVAPALAEQLTHTSPRTWAGFPSGYVHEICLIILKQWC